MSELPIPIDRRVTLGKRPASPSDVRKFVKWHIRLGDDDTWKDQMTPGLKGAMVGFLDKYSGGKMYRYAILKYIFSYKFKDGKTVSSKELTGAEWMGLYQWIVPGKATPTSKWGCHPALEDECSALLLKIANSELASTYKSIEDRAEELGFSKESDK